MNSFNSRARAGRDCCNSRRGAQYLSFNSRARAGRDGILYVMFCVVTMFQFTRPRGARLPRPTSGAQGGAVSIHAPARGATKQANLNCGGGGFQFTRPRGARLRQARHDGDDVGFNSRARAGRDTQRDATLGLLQGFNSRARAGRDWRVQDTVARSGVSIHAPARGATFAFGLVPELPCFNSRARAGRDNHQSPHHQPGLRFNSRARAGRDDMARVRRRSPERFNSRARAGRDCPETANPEAVRVSIHAPARGATHVQLLPAGRIAVSIHAPARGATGQLAYTVVRLEFQFTRPRGARHGACACLPRMAVSIHAPTRGATIFLHHVLWSHNVSIHAPTRGATTPMPRESRRRRFQFTRPRGARPR